MDMAAEQLFTAAFNAGVRYAEEPDAKKRLARVVEDRKAFEAIHQKQQSGPPAAAEPVAITEAEVEAGAKVLFADLAYIEGETGPAWKGISERARDRWRGPVRLILEAAESARRGGQQP